MSAVRFNPRLDVQIVLDDWTPGKQRDMTAVFLDKDSIILTRDSGGTPFKSGRGWTPKPEQISDEGSHWGTLPAGTWGSDLLSSHFGRDSAKPGVVSSPSGILASYTNPFPASGSPSFSVSDGHTGPTWAGAVPFDRWFVSTATYTPDTPWVFSFKIPRWYGCYGLLARIYFNGPCGVKNANAGNGRYCMMLYADGTAELQEQLESTLGWFGHGRSRWCEGTPSAGQHTLLIDPEPQGGIWLYVSGNIVETIIDTAILALGSDKRSWKLLFQTNDGTATKGAQALGKTMIEVRRDVTCEVHISAIIQPTTAAFDKTLHLRGCGEDATASYPIRLTWSNYEPSGSTLVGKLQYWTGSAWADCTASGSKTAMSGGWYQDFVLVANCETYRIYWTFTPNTDGLCPILQSYTLYRAGRYHIPSGITPVTITDRIVEVYIDDGGADPTQSYATVVLEHDGSLIDPLELRAQIPIRIEAVTVPPSDPMNSAEADPAPTVTATLFQGRILECDSEPTTTLFYTGQTPGTSRRCILKCVSEGWRLMEMLTRHNIDLKKIGETGGNSGNTTVIQAIQAVMGSTGSTPISGSSSMLDVPSWTMPLLFADDEPALLETLSPVWENVRKWVEDFLGSYMVYDPSAVPAAGDPATHKYGMFRVKALPEGTEDPVARFYESVPTFTGQTGHKITGHWESYYNPGETPANRIPAGFIFGGTMGKRVFAPEFNEVIVTGVGLVDSGGTLSKVEAVNLKLTAHLRNYKSAKFLDSQTVAPDPGSCDYLGRVVTAYRCDPGFSTQQVVDNVAKRMLRMGGQGGYLFGFDGPAILMQDAADTLQQRPRLLRFGDVVEYIPTIGAAFLMVVTRARTLIKQELGGAMKARCTYEIQSPMPEIDDTHPIAREAYS